MWGLRDFFQHGANMSKETLLISVHQFGPSQVQAFFSPSENPREAAERQVKQFLAQAQRDYLVETPEARAHDARLAQLRTARQQLADAEAAVRQAEESVADAIDGGIDPAGAESRLANERTRQAALEERIASIQRLVGQTEAARRDGFRRYLAERVRARAEQIREAEAEVRARLDKTLAGAIGADISELAMLGTLSAELSDASFVDRQAFLKPAAA
jgi:hypothetical protein